MKLTEINRIETLRYLGYTGGALDAQVEIQLDRASEAVLELAQPRFVYQVFPLAREAAVLRLQGTNFTLAGEDIPLHLAGADQCALMAFTLGSDLEEELRRAQVTDMAYAVILNAVADAAVEQGCDTVQKEIEARAKTGGRYLTGRFSPGYGDFPLCQQQDICALLDTARRIGVSVTERHILTPRKSVTAVLGLCRDQTAEKSMDCAKCPAADGCNLRKAGKTCGKTPTK